MTSNYKNKIELVVNVLLAVAAVTITGITVKRYLFQDQGGAKQQSSQVVVGARMNVPNVNWEENKKTLAFFLKKDCAYCTSSAPFYRQLIEEAAKRGVKLLAVFPHSVEEGRAYLDSLGLRIENVQSGSLASYKIPGTPTMMLLDHTGRVISVWIGGVTPAREQEIRDDLIPLFEAEIVRKTSAQVTPKESGGGAPAGSVAEDIDAAELKKIIEGKENVTVVDVDEREDYKKEHIPGAKNFPSDELFARAAREIPKDGRIVVYCRCQGYGASGGAKSELVKQGYSRVSILRGGLNAWKEIGMPVEHSN